MSKLLFFLAFLFCTSTLTAQMKQGDVVYEVKILGLDEATSEMLSGTDMTMTFNKKMSKVVLEMMVMTNTTIIDLKSQEGVMLFNAMGQKIKVLMPKEHVSEGMIDDYSLVPTKEKMRLAGYECRVHTIESDQGEFTMCLTDDIKFDSAYNTRFVDLDGFPLQYTMDYSGMMISLTAKEVVKRKVKKGEFVVPEGYTEKSIDELTLPGM